MPLPRIISFSGRKRCGKTELLNVCAQYGYKSINFADELKSLVCNIVNITSTDLEIKKDVTLSVPFDLTSNIEYISQETRIPESIVRKHCLTPKQSIREILQCLGTNLIRAHNPDWHVDKVREKLNSNSHSKYCFGDTRFTNEKAFLEELQGECWFIIRTNNFDISNHLSETSLKWTDFGKNVIVNNTHRDSYVNNWKTHLEAMNNDSHPIKSDHATKGEEFGRCLTPGKLDKAFLLATPTDSYNIGLLTSNGRLDVDDKGESALVFTNEDKNLINIYKKNLLANTQVQLENKPYSVTCQNPYVIENLKLWNVGLQEPMILSIPSLLLEDEEMLKYWAIGLVDGSGTVSFLDGRLCIRICSTIDILSYFKKRFSGGDIQNVDDILITLILQDDVALSFVDWLGVATTKVGIDSNWHQVDAYRTYLM